MGVWEWRNPHTPTLPYVVMHSLQCGARPRRYCVKNHNEIDLWAYERDAVARGQRVVAGIDEAGRGPLAGPVVAAAVILPMDCDIQGIFDSKQLSARKRDSAFDKIQETALGIGVGIVEEADIDRINILQATYRAMRGAVAGLGIRADVYLVDGYPIRDFEYAQVGIVDGDCKSASIAAASIVAKVTRDRIMCMYDEMFPQYGFARHKGYPTEEHMRLMGIHGVCEIHRRTFGPVRDQLKLPW
jgi:ribonuclease HII